MLRILIYILLCVLCSCVAHRDRHLEYVLQQAGKNRVELEKVLVHYADDSLKLEASKFLIRNMVYHTGFYDTLVDIEGKEYMPDIYMALVGYLNDSIAYVGTMPLYSSIEMVDKYRRSNCEGIAVYTSFVMRALGIPFALDCTTWAKMEDGHCWGVLMKEDGEWQVFSHYGLDSGQHKVLFSKIKKIIPPKVYRRLFLPESVDWGVADDGRKCIVNDVVGDNTFLLAECPDGRNLCFLTDTFYVDSIGHIVRPIKFMK